MVTISNVVVMVKCTKKAERLSLKWLQALYKGFNRTRNIFVSKVLFQSESVVSAILN